MYMGEWKTIHFVAYFEVKGWSLFFLATGVIYLLIEMNNKSECTIKAFLFNKMYKL